MGVFLPTWFRNFALHKLKSSHVITMNRIYLLGDIMSDYAFTVSSSSFGVDNTFWDSFTSEVSELVNKIEVLNEDGATGTCSH